MERNDLIYIAGHNGMVGSAILQHLRDKGFTNLLTRSRSELDLTNQGEVEQFFSVNKPTYVILSAAKVGGILANSEYPGQFIYDNLAIQNNVIHYSKEFGVKKLLFLGSSCIYPKNAKQPMKEEYLLSGPLEPTNEAYAIAKIAGIKMCESYFKQYNCNFISVMPTNLYGKNDNFDLKTSHVLPAIMRKIHEAKMLKHEHVDIWGSGQVKREFLHVDDMASACISIMENLEAHTLYHEYGISHINIGSGFDITIHQLSELLKKIIGYTGDFIFDKSKPDGTPRKLLDITHLKAIGWRPGFTLESGILDTYEWYKQTQNGQD
jgi:GDP-L-fucose synthase